MVCTPAPKPKLKAGYRGERMRKRWKIRKGERSASQKRRWRRWLKAKERIIAKMVAKGRIADSKGHDPAPAYTLSDTYTSALAAGINLGERQLCRPEPPDNPMWYGPADHEAFGGDPLDPVDTASWRWWQSLPEATRMSLYEVEHYPKDATGYVELVNPQIAKPGQLDFLDWGKRGVGEKMVGGWVVMN